MQPTLRTVLETPWALTSTALSRLVDSLAGRGQLPTEFTTRQTGGSVRSGAVSIIPVYGFIDHRSSLIGSLLGGTSIDELRASLARELADPTVGAVVLDVDSPGGSAEGMTEFADELRATRGGGKPIVAVANTLAASAAYWIASQADELVVTPSGAVGSIGIIGVHQESSRKLDAEGVTTTLISAGPFKAEANEFEPLTDEARIALQERADALYDLFIADVAKGRRVGLDQVRSNYGQGRIMLPRQALEVGMVDRVETLDATVRRLGRAANAAVGARRTRASLPQVAPEDESPAVALSASTPDETELEAPAEPTFTYRLSVLADDAADLVAHAGVRAGLRAKEHRPAFSTATEASLRSIRDSLDELLEPADPAHAEAEAVDPLVAEAPAQPAVASAPPRFRSNAEWLTYLTTRRNQ